MIAVMAIVISSGICKPTGPQRLQPSSCPQCDNNNEETNTQNTKYEIERFDENSVIFPRWFFSN